MCSKMWLHAIPLLMHASEACQILAYEFAYAPKVHSPQKPIVMNLHKTNMKLRSLLCVETECEKAEGIWAMSNYCILSWFDAARSQGFVRTLQNDNVLLGNEIRKLFKETIMKMVCYLGVSEQEQYIRYIAYATGRAAEES